LLDLSASFRRRAGKLVPILGELGVRRSKSRWRVSSPPAKSFAAGG
jgi:hypothetical protein